MGGEVMSMMGDIAVEGAVQRIVQKLKPLYDRALGQEREAYRQAMLAALYELEMESDWSRELRKELGK